ncbi:hypothetical protein ACOSQ2_008236 [Xanthoceras sorbifolium]
MATRSTMITRNKRSASGDNLEKEKRGISPSNNSHTQKSTITRSASEKLSSSSTSSEKPTPNYLKSTISLSSRQDQSLNKPNVKKSSSGTGTTEDSAAANQKLLRRRSFDRPPSSSPRIQKALVSPPARPRDRASPLVSKERTITARSSSFSGRSTSSTTAISSKPVLDRSTTSLSSRLSLDGKSSFALKTPKAVKSQPVFTSRTTKKSAKTKECNAASSSSTKTLNHQEAKQEDEKDCQDNHDQVNEDKVESEIQVNDQIPKLENNIEEVDDDNENEKTIDNNTLTVSEDQNVLNRAAHIEETENESREEEEEEKEEEAKIEENPKEIDVAVVEEEEADNGDHHEETQDGEEKLGEEPSDHHHEIGDEIKVEEKSHDHGDQEGGGDLEAAAKQEAGNENSAASPTASAMNKWSGGQGKESPTAYNDVIEETAGKLLEKRKNKVKALVGAFETVIDYESGASK